MRGAGEENEIVDIVDRQGRVVGREPRASVHGNPALLHPVVHVHVLNSKNELLLQKRAACKLVQPDKWDTAVGGHVVSGESVAGALEAEVGEELGIDLINPVLLFSYVHVNDFESEFVYVHRMLHEGPFNPNPQEVAELRFWPFAAIEASLHSGVFTTNFVEEYRMLLDCPGFLPTV